MLKKILSRFGYEIKPIGRKYWDRGWHISKLRQIAPQIKTCVDVGVGYGTPKLYEAFQDSFHVLIDPLEEYKPSIEKILENYNGQYFMTAVGAKEDVIKISVEIDKLTRSTFYKRTQLTSRINAKLKDREVPVTTLDTLLKKHNFQVPFGLKIDTEGGELNVIRGAKEFLNYTEFVIAEVSINKRFEESYEFSEFTEEMMRSGFYLHDILSIAGMPPKYMDAVFKKKL